MDNKEILNLALIHGIADEDLSKDGQIVSDYGDCTENVLNFAEAIKDDVLKDFNYGVQVRHYLFGIICIASSHGTANLKWMRIDRDMGGYYCYFRFTLPFALVIRDSLHTLTINIRKPKSKWQD